jgi:uncharacterized membrane protein YeiH
VAFALSGFSMAARHRLDLLGVVIAAMLTALGGGILRDLLVGHTPRALVETGPILTVLGTIVIAWALRLHRRRAIEERLLFVVSDSVGLIAFSITGALVGLETGISFFGVLLLAFVTAVGGGLLRDMLLSEVPLILCSEFYGSVAILVAAGLWGLDAAGWLSAHSLVLLFLLGLLLRLVAYFRHWRLPRL